MTPGSSLRLAQLVQAHGLPLRVVGGGTEKAEDLAEYVQRKPV